MIRTFYQEDIINHLAAIFTYGLNEGYSYKAIGERIVSSPFVNDLERNQYDIGCKMERIIESTYGISLNGKQADISFKGLFIAESYFKLFLYYHKSFEYLFLYWPLGNFVERYGIYHEMGFSNLRNDFISKTKEMTLLKKLSRDRQIKPMEMSKLTGINIKTIHKYNMDDRYLYEASYKNIYKLSLLFGVKESLFVEVLPVYLDQSIYLFDERNKGLRDYLGLYFASYFDHRIDEKAFRYDQGAGYFVSNDGVKCVIIAKQLSDLSVSDLNIVADPKTYLIIIPSGAINMNSTYKDFKKLDALEVFVLTQDYFYAIKKDHKKEITDTVYQALVTKTMEKIAL